MSGCFLQRQQLGLVVYVQPRSSASNLCKYQVYACMPQCVSVGCVCPEHVCSQTHTAFNGTQTPNPNPNK
ncbi:hypothetical protein NEUTE1DRAFT_117365 [Neurospora tetrasperma FGSC 2508]|uniref:Uncharacterized protein n=1 Tax=Neurospora tetrasperma (strain FGSC 2508 / ATCC MYA-4615 / P0657) TaxID=510951 RepID=F8MQ92_NEUT8|nr:uncharacterized protein NEUTE1DRAFT_117365 [Neurospora tetrasperma FGSC 2508]EGO56522.1 hypothetical protein NEUTE1DRAFT_117365 [Neurospora tetrasperma FGSC 2508]EGZ70612.1 hypothetical protein NEUTE2DRAFT_145112 [Neurospora tetrasperma FGSC 2509]